MRGRCTPRAESEVDREQSRWREHRPNAPDLLDEELVQAIRQIAVEPCTHPTAGAEAVAAAETITGDLGSGDGVGSRSPS